MKFINKKTKILSYFPQIIAMLFLAGFVAYAWTEPASAPPGGNVDAPINVGPASQLKSGALGVGGVLRGYANAIFDGNVGIGTISPQAKLDVQGGDAKVGTVTIKGDGSVSTNLNADKLDGLDSTEIKRQGLYGWCSQGSPGTFSEGQCSAYSPALCIPSGAYLACSCPAGYLQVTTGYSDTYQVWYKYSSCYKQ